MEFKSFEDIKYILIEDVAKDPIEVENIKAIREENLNVAYGFFGAWIRNNYRLNDPENPLCTSSSPEEISNRLIKEVWEYFNVK